MTQSADPRRRARRGGAPPLVLLVRALVPAAYAAALLAGVYAPERAWSFVAVSILASFTAYFLWRIHGVAMLPPVLDPELERGELGLLAVLALSTALQVTGAPTPWALLAYSVLLIGLAASVPLLALLVLPLGAISLWAANPPALEALAHLEAVALVSGAVLFWERRRRRQIQLALDKLQLHREHLREGGPGERARPDEMLYEHLVKVKEGTGAHGAVLVLARPRGEMFVRELVSDSHAVRESAVLKVEGTTFQWILENRRHLQIPCLRDPASRLGYYTGNVPVKSFLGVPVVAGDQVEGVLAVDGLQENAFTEAHVPTLTVAAHQVATILAQVRALDAAKREVRDFKHLQEFSKGLATCRAVPEVVGVMLETLRTRNQPEFSAVALLGEGKELRIEGVGDARWGALQGQTFRSGDGLAGWVLESRRYLTYLDERSRRPLFGKQVKSPEFQSLILQPLTAGEEALGVLCVGALAPKAFDLATVDVCEIVAQQGAEALGRIRAHGELERLATTDPLTGLRNRRVFFERLEEEVRRTRRYEQGVSVLLLDVDHFKKINDTFGHPAGDAVLEALARSVETFARETDLVARYGGEEMAVLLPNTTEAGARALAERLREGVEKLEVPWEDKSIPVRVSVGVACLEGEREPADHLVARADRCLYAAKQGGRNRVVAYAEIREYDSWK